MSFNTTHTQNFNTYDTRTAGAHIGMRIKTDISPNKTASTSAFDFKAHLAQASESNSQSTAQQTNAHTKQDIKAPAAEERTANTADRTAKFSSYTQSSESDWSFWDFLDVINPLQHIPIINTVYRSITGDEINDTARIMGGALYGGIPGAAMGVANAVVNQATGKDVGEHALAMLQSNKSSLGTGTNNPMADDPMENGVMMAQKLNTIQPASGNADSSRSPIKAEDIIWSTPNPQIFTQNNLSKSFLSEVSAPTKPDNPMTEGLSRANSTPTQSSRSSTETITKQRTPYRQVEESRVLPGAGKTRFLNSQKAQVKGTEETNLPPALIAQEMTQALNQLRDIKRQGHML